ncbi:MAG: HAMP domain-containing sensor histidine kinase [Candidatus Dormiibacterota bacterium]
MQDPAPITDDPGTQDDASRRLFREAVRLASRLASAPGISRQAWLLLLRGDFLACVAASDLVEPSARGPYRVSDHPAFDRAISSGLTVDDPPAVIVPVRGDERVAALLVVSGEGRLSADARGTLQSLAGIVGHGVSQAAMADELLQEAERSRRLERLKSEFLNIAAHELRSPLGIIRGYSSMLGEGVLPPAERRVALSRITEKAEEMARLISDMLETARLETLGLELELEPLDLLRVIEDAVQSMRPLMSEEHRFAVTTQRDSVAVVADRRRLTTMLTNLIDNAIKYSPAGGTIEIGCEDDGRAMSIVVRDHGIGINAEQAHLLFSRFGRLVTPETSHIRGTGLGLYLARETARLHGGDIAVTATPGGGSTFTVVLPLA